MFCGSCGKEVNENAVVCLSCGCKIERKPETKVNNENVEYSSKKRSIAILLQFLIGFGAGMFYLKKYIRATAMLVGSIIGLIMCYVPMIFIYFDMLANLDNNYYDPVASLFGVLASLTIGSLIITGIGIWSIVECCILAFGKNVKDGEGSPLIEG